MDLGLGVEPWDCRLGKGSSVMGSEVLLGLRAAVGVDGLGFGVGVLEEDVVKILLAQLDGVDDGPRGRLVLPSCCMSALQVVQPGDTVGNDVQPLSERLSSSVGSSDVCNSI